jgi:signal transduction histidine kinase
VCTEEKILNPSKLRGSFIFALLLSHAVVFAQNKTVDSLYVFIQAHQEQDTIRVKALNELSHQYLWIDYYRSLQHAESALTLARELNYTKGIIIANNLKGFCYWAFGDNDLAIEMSLKASTLAEKENLPMLLAECFLTLSRAYSDLGENQKARSYVNQAEKITVNTKNWQLLSSIYNWKGVIYSIDSKPDSAFVYYTKALAIAELYAIPKINLPRIISNIGECYLKKSNQETAFAYFNRALLLAQETGNKTAEAAITGIMGHAFLGMKDYKQSEIYFQRSLEIANKLKVRRTLRHVYLGLVTLTQQQGKADEALVYMEKYYKVRDSLINTSKARLIVELESKHEIEKKEQAIKLLEKEKIIQTIWRNILIVGVSAVLLIAYFIYRTQLAKAKKTNQLLELQKILYAKLQDADRQKTSFFNNISHEFRTPLTLILAPLENLMKKKGFSEEAESLQLIKRNANRLLELVNQLLDISKLDAGMMELHIKPGNFKELLTYIANSFDSLSDQMKIEFNKKVLIDEGIYWYDQDKIEKIIGNILSNAFKHTPAHGTVTLDIRSENGSFVSISVTDTGHGIPKEEQGYVFLPFYQVKKSTQHGTGLGLSLVKELVKLYKGTITLQSNVGEGSTFTIVLPISKKFFENAQIPTAEVETSIAKSYELPAASL